MSIEQPYFCDRFMFEDFKTVGLLRRSFYHNVGVQGAHYEPILQISGGGEVRDIPCPSHLI